MHPIQVCFTCPLVRRRLHFFCLACVHMRLWFQLTNLNVRVLVLWSLQDCDCEDNCEKCSVVFSLDVSWEGKAAERAAEHALSAIASDNGEFDQDAPVFVTSFDLMSHNENVRPVHFAER